MKVSVAKIMHNTICVLCCTAWAISFQKWWIVLMAFVLCLTTGNVVVEVEDEDDKDEK